MYDTEQIKERLQIEDVYDLLDWLGAEPRLGNDIIISKTICHNGNTHKLYYYDNTQLFKCYTGECGSFDIFDLISKIKDYSLSQSINFIVKFFNLENFLLEDWNEEGYSSEDWKIINRYNNLNDETNSEIQFDEDIVLPSYDINTLKYYPKPRILNWEREGISKDICDYMQICFNPIDESILIPHFDVNNRLIGIRERTLIKQNEKYGKYRPARIDNTLYNHPLAFNLYGLNVVKKNIESAQVAIVVESEKAVLQSLSFFGLAGSLCVAVCGSSISDYQFNLLMKCGIKELIIGFDRDFNEIGSMDFYSCINKLKRIYNRYNPFINISFLIDKDCNQLTYKASPLDCGKDKFLYLFRNRIVL